MMKDRFDYADLKDMAQTFAADNESMALRVEVIKEMCELPGIRVNWRDLMERHLPNGTPYIVYLATNPEILPSDPFWFKRMVCEEAGARVILRQI